MPDNPTPLDRDFVLHTLVIKGVASADVLSNVTGITGTRVEVALGELQRQELATLREGRIAGWMPTKSGREIHKNLLSGPLAPRDPDRVRVSYERFAEINGSFKDLCLRWQLHDGVVNDHSDPAYDIGLIEELFLLDEVAADLCDEMSSSLARVAAYRQRLADALDALQRGDRDKFTRPLYESYHDIWMELHHDLITTLGLQRTADDA